MLHGRWPRDEIRTPGPQGPGRGAGSHGGNALLGVLMQRAAAGLASVSAGLVGKVPGARVVVLAGSGDNGGDALYAGARLASRGAACGPSRRARGCMRRARPRCGPRGAGGAPRDEAASPAAPARGRPDPWTACSGSGGLRRAAAAQQGLRWLRWRRHPRPWWSRWTCRAAVDADTGVVEGAAIQADVTVTFGTPKPGLLIDPGARRAGVVELVDIGLGPYLAAPDARAMQAGDVRAPLPRPAEVFDKHRRGVVGIVVESAGEFTGAAALAVGGAIRGGAGMVRLASSAPAVAVVRSLDGSGDQSYWAGHPGR